MSAERLPSAQAGTSLYLNIAARKSNSRPARRARLETQLSPLKIDALKKRKRDAFKGVAPARSREREVGLNA
ncbi:MAG TPA: hypothetical protein VGB73_01980 [Pyrinomonadaceae bacterium]